MQGQLCVLACDMCPAVLACLPNTSAGMPRTCDEYHWLQVKHRTVKTSKPGPNGEEFVWWQCTVKGGREGRDIGAVELAQAVEALGAGEILLNCIDNDGAGKVSGTQWRMCARAHNAHFLDVMVTWWCCHVSRPYWL